MKTLATFAVLLLTACVAPIGTPSGRPEVVARAPAAELVPRIQERMLATGYMQTNETSSMLVFERPEPGLRAQLAVGGQPIRRVTFNLVKQDDATHVLASVFLIGTSTMDCSTAETARELNTWLQTLAQ